MLKQIFLYTTIILGLSLSNISAQDQTPSLYSTQVDRALSNSLNREGKWTQIIWSDGSGPTTTHPTATGDVTGPASSTDNTIVRFDSTTGKLLQDSGAILDDSDNLSGVPSLTYAGAFSITATDSAFNITIGTGAGDDFIINTTGFVYEGDTGNVGIGTDSPATLLEVAGDVQVGDTSRITINGDTNDDGIVFGSLGTATKAIDLENSGLSGTTDYLIFFNNNNYWQSTGRMTATNYRINNTKFILNTDHNGPLTVDITSEEITKSLWLNSGVDRPTFLNINTNSSILSGNGIAIDQWVGDGVSNGTTTITDVGGAAHGLSLAAGDLVHIQDATTSADEGYYRIVSDDGTNVVVDRALAGSDTDLTVTFYQDIIGFFATDGTNGQRITNYSHQDKPLQIGGDTLAATTGLTSEDVILGAATLNVDSSAGNIGIGRTDPIAALSMGNDKLIARDVNANITASTTQTQGQGALTAEINEISAVANNDDTVTLPTAVAGLFISVINNGANNLQIFPASGDNLGAGIDIAQELEANEDIVYVSYDNTNWRTAATTEIIHVEMHDEDNTDAFVISDAGADFHSYHTNGITSGDLIGWTFDIGGGGTSFPIASIVDGVASGVDIEVTTTGSHLLAVGDIISQTNLADAAYVGIFKVKAIISATQYEVAAVFTATGTGTIDQASVLSANTGSAGSYQILYYISATSATNNETFDFQLYKETTGIVGTKIRRKFGTAADFGSMSGGGIIDVANGDKISIVLSNEDSAGNITIRNISLILIRL